MTRIWVVPYVVALSVDSISREGSMNLASHEARMRWPVPSSIRRISHA